MRICFSVCLLVAAACPAGWSQTTPPTTLAPPRKSAAATAAARKPMATTSTGPVAVIDTTAGKMTCTLFPDKAPIGVANFIGLSDGTKDWTNPISHAKKHGVPLYDGTIFHRVIPNFMIQGGDPAGSGNGDPGFAFKNETSPTLKFERPGRLAYANAGPNTNGSQFFITVGPTDWLTGKHTIFGEVVEGQDVVHKITAVPRNRQDRPAKDVVVKKVTIERS